MSYEHWNDPSRLSDYADPLEPGEPEARRRPAPGKVTLTQRIAPIYRHVDGGGSPAAPAAQAVEDARSSSGSALDPATEAYLAAAFGTDLTGVRVHTGRESQAAAQALGARAYTEGQDIHFAPGHYDPGSREGRRLLAHEVAHTLQQRGAATATQGKLEVSSPGDAAEVEADRFADAVTMGLTPPPIRASAPRSLHREAAGPEYRSQRHATSGPNDANALARSRYAATYADTVRLGQVIGKEHIQRVLLEGYEPVDFIALARAKDDFLLEEIDRLGLSPEETARAKHEVAKTLLMMFAIFQRRLSEPTIAWNSYIDIAWEQGSSMAGLIEASIPFRNADIWRTFIITPPRRRARPRPRQPPAPAPTPEPEENATIEADRPEPDIPEEDIQDALEHIDELMEDPEEFWDILFPGMDILGTLIGGTVGTALNIIATIAGTAVTAGQTVQQQHAVNEAIGFKWGVNKFYTQVLVRGRDQAHVAVNAEEAWAAIQQLTVFHSQIKRASPASPEGVKDSLHKGVNGAATVTQALIDEVEARLRTYLDERSSGASDAAIEKAYLEHVQTLRMEAMKRLLRRVGKKTKRLPRMP